MKTILRELPREKYRAHLLAAKTARMRCENAHEWTATDATPKGSERKVWDRVRCPECGAVAVRMVI